MVKIFCIGYNKTGTTSMATLFINEGFKVAPQEPFERCIWDYLSGNYQAIVDLIKRDYNDCIFFQDIPFSLPFMYEALEKAFPDALFILTVRNSSREWYQSAIRYYTKLKIITPSPGGYKVRKGEYYSFLENIVTKVYGAPLTDQFNRPSLMRSYEAHIQRTETHFAGKNKMIKINLADGGDFVRLQHFLKMKFKATKFPHELKTK